MYLILIETSGNQSYIFATNKLRENVGASELTYRAGTEWVLQAVQDITDKPLWSENVATLRENLCRPDLNPPIDPNHPTAVEVITATSGKALLLVNDREVGRRIVRAVTRKALQEAPGLDVCGVISDEFDFNLRPIGTVNEAVHRKFEEARASRPAPALRFLRVPVVDECETSGLPAAAWVVNEAGDPREKVARSNLSLQKRAYADAYRRRMQALLDRYGINRQLPRNPGDLEKQCEWLAVVHADGNGLGQIFLNFAAYIDFEREQQTAGNEVLNRRYVERMRAFSLALDVCTEKAFVTALTAITERKLNGDDEKVLPLLPIILGGDDLTVMCDGKNALRFTHKFLTAFETETAREVQAPFDGILSKVAGVAFSPNKRLSACAGVAIIKPHFPFSAAYDLAAELILSAKQVKKLITNPNKKDSHTPDHKTPWPCSALDFHALYDSSSSQLASIREKLRYRNQAENREVRSYARPYVVTPVNELRGADGADWAVLHHWDSLARQVEAILAPELDDSGQATGRRKLPNTQLHELRAGLPLKKEIADGRFKLIQQRYDLSLFAGEHAETLYRSEQEETGSKIEFTTLLDAMDAANFWRKDDAA
ncbi:MAG: hypothetical protein U0Z53_31200 [Blastocatellia bacterium]